jgi:cephalosporin-C deacetylase
MPLVDLPLPELQVYRPRLTREGDFDRFWEDTLQEAAGAPLAEAQRRIASDWEGLYAELLGHRP